MTDRTARCPWCTHWFAVSVLTWHMDRCMSAPADEDVATRLREGA